MKKTLLLCVLGLFAMTVNAQEVAQKPSFKGFVNNGFWDNWEVSLGGGVNFIAYEGYGFKQDIRKDLVGWSAEATGTKWFNPVIGLRAQLVVGEFGKATNKTSYVLPHVDAIANLSNWIGGYRADRVYYAKVFAGFGGNMVGVNGDNINGGIVGAFGLLNSFRVSPKFDINLELKKFVIATRDLPAPVNYLGEEASQILQATIGATYRFNEREWQRGVPGYTAEDIKAFQDAVAAGAAATAAAKAANAKLAKQLKDTEAVLADTKAAAAAAAAEAAAAKAAAEAAEANSVKSLVLYDYGMSNLTAREKTRLDLMADMIKNGPKDRVYHLEGHADYQTGTKAGNARVADNRAKKAYNYLVKQGVNPDQLTYKGYGDEANPFAVQKANRAVVIK
ncbi:MAG: OmpA family protein [Alistipes sp.]|nr:OmpA family protein [Alistipes sp.]